MFSLFLNFRIEKTVVMNVNCSTCLELLTPSDELSSVPCGHVFHTPCILQWLETGKNNCPQCRTRCRENQLRRVYFTEGVESSTQSDANTLQNRLDSITFQLRCSESEKKSFKESVDELTAKNVGLKEEFKNLEKKYKKIKEEQATMRDQLKLYQSEYLHFAISHELPIVISSSCHFNFFSSNILILLSFVRYMIECSDKRSSFISYTI